LFACEAYSKKDGGSRIEHGHTACDERRCAEDQARKAEADTCHTPYAPSSDLESWQDLFATSDQLIVGLEDNEVVAATPPPLQEEVLRPTRPPLRSSTLPPTAIEMTSLTKTLAVLEPTPEGEEARDDVPELHATQDTDEVFIIPPPTGAEDSVLLSVAGAPAPHSPRETVAEPNPDNDDQLEVRIPPSPTGSSGSDSDDTIPETQSLIEHLRVRRAKQLSLQPPPPQMGSIEKDEVTPGFGSQLVSWFLESDESEEESDESESETEAMEISEKAIVEEAATLDTTRGRRWFTREAMAKILKNDYEHDGESSWRLPLESAVVNGHSVQRVQIELKEVTLLYPGGGYQTTGVLQWVTEGLLSFIPTINFRLETPKLLGHQDTRRQVLTTAVLTQGWFSHNFNVGSRRESTLELAATYYEHSSQEIVDVHLANFILESKTMQRATAVDNGGGTSAQLMLKIKGVIGKYPDQAYLASNTALKIHTLMYVHNRLILEALQYKSVDPTFAGRIGISRKRVSKAEIHLNPRLLQPPPAPCL